MKLKVGGFYLNGRGEKIGPLEANDGSNFWPFTFSKDYGRGWYFRSDGVSLPCRTYDPGLRQDRLEDLVSEWYSSPVREETKVSVHSGVYGALQITDTANGAGVKMKSFYLSELETVDPDKLRLAAHALLNLADFYDKGD